MKGKKWIPSYDGFVIEFASMRWMKWDEIMRWSLGSAFEGGDTELSLDCQKDGVFE